MPQRAGAKALEPAIEAPLKTPPPLPSTVQVWPVRDAGWLEVLRALQQNEEAAQNLQSWFPPASGLMERIQEMHAAYPNGFTVVKDEVVHEEAFAKKKNRRRGSTYANELRRDIKAFSLDTHNESRDDASLADLMVRREMKTRYNRIRISLLVSLKGTSGSQLLDTDDLFPSSGKPSLK